MDSSIRADLARNRSMERMARQRSSDRLREAREDLEKTRKKLEAASFHRASLELADLEEGRLRTDALRTEAEWKKSQKAAEKEKKRLEKDMKKSQKQEMSLRKKAEKDFDRSRKENEKDANGRKINDFTTTSQVFVAIGFWISLAITLWMGAWIMVLFCPVYVLLCCCILTPVPFNFIWLMAAAYTTVFLIVYFWFIYPPFILVVITAVAMGVLLKMCFKPQYEEVQFVDFKPPEVPVVVEEVIPIRTPAPKSPPRERPQPSRSPLLVGRTPVKRAQSPVLAQMTSDIQKVHYGHVTFPADENREKRLYELESELKTMKDANTSLAHMVRRMSNERLTKPVAVAMRPSSPPTREFHREHEAEARYQAEKANIEQSLARLRTNPDYYHQPQHIKDQSFPSTVMPRHHNNDTSRPPSAAPTNE